MSPNTAKREGGEARVLTFGLQLAFFLVIIYVLHRS